MMGNILKSYFQLVHFCSHYMKCLHFNIWALDVYGKTIDDFHFWTELFSGFGTPF